LWLEGDELEAVEVEDVAAAFAGSVDLEALFGVGGVDTHGGAVGDAGGNGGPEFVADPRGDGADVDTGFGFDEPAGEGAAYVVGYGGGGDDDH